MVLIVCPQLGVVEVDLARQNSTVRKESVCQYSTLAVEREVVAVLPSGIQNTDVGVIGLRSLQNRQRRYGAPHLQSQYQDVKVRALRYSE